MEEFYRRKYLSPSYSHTSPPPPESTLQKDKSVAELRRELQECKQMEERFDDLCLEIVRLERENKKIESEQSQIEGDYLTQIKKNKLRITELKQDVLDCRETIQATCKKIAASEKENEQLSQEIPRIKQQNQKVSEEKTALRQQLEQQRKIMDDLMGKIEDTRAACSLSKKQSQTKSAELEKNYEELKRNQLKLKEEELACQGSRCQWEQLAKESQEWQKKLEVSRSALESVKASLERAQNESNSSSLQYKSVEGQHKQYIEGYAATQKEAKLTVLNNKENLTKLKINQRTLLQSLKQCQKDQVYLEKVKMREAELKRGNQRLEETLKQLSELLGEQQESYGRIIGHMKQSIQQDEKAIQNLSKQAVLLQTMIN